MNGIKQLTWMEGLGFHYALCFKCACLITSEIEWNNKLSSHYGSETQVEFCQKSLDSWASSHGYMHLVRQEEALCTGDVKCSAVHGREPPRDKLHERPSLALWNMHLLPKRSARQLKARTPSTNQPSHIHLWPPDSYIASQRRVVLHLQSG